MDKKVMIEMCNNISKNTLNETLSIKFIDIGEDFVKAKMPVNKSVHQPDGILHGGATAALAETVGSTAAFVLLKRKDIIVRGIEISSNHLKSISEGEVIATAKPINLGRTIQLWDIKITNQKGELISISKLTTYTRINKKWLKFFINDLNLKIKN